MKFQRAPHIITSVIVFALYANFLSNDITISRLLFAKNKTEIYRKQTSFCFLKEERRGEELISLSFRIQRRGEKKP